MCDNDLGGSGAGTSDGDDLTISTIANQQPQQAQNTLENRYLIATQTRAHGNCDTSKEHHPTPLFFWNLSTQSRAIIQSTITTFPKQANLHLNKQPSATSPHTLPSHRQNKAFYSLTLHTEKSQDTRH